MIADDAQAKVTGFLRNYDIHLRHYPDTRPEKYHNPNS
jgi:hypothetical protein